MLGFASGGSVTLGRVRSGLPRCRARSPRRVDPICFGVTARPRFSVGYPGIGGEDSPKKSDFGVYVFETHEVEDTVNEADKDRAEAAKLPAGDIVAILYTQHAAVRDVMDTVESTSGSERKRAFEELATMLKAHETAEESVVRPVTQQTAGAEVATARNAEEDEANQVLATLKTLEVDSADFDAKFADFKTAVSDHAEAEEHDEFPSILTGRTVDERHELGLKFLAAFEASGGTI